VKTGWTAGLFDYWSSGGPEFAHIIKGMVNTLERHFPIHYLHNKQSREERALA
jgi:hypothetical protein